MKQVLSSHNKNLLATTMPKVDERTCAWPRAKQDAGECPLQGHCLSKNNVYQATVVETNTKGEEKVETYVGVSAPPWKGRYRHHTKSFDNPGYKGEIVLSTHIWELKARGSTYKVSWQGAEWDECVS